jgi:membrane protease YdiL (CAAX protease family)
MSDLRRFILGVVICLGIYGLGMWAVSWEFLSFSSWIPSSFPTHTMFIIFSLVCMYCFGGGSLSEFGLKRVSPGKLLKPILVLAVTFVGVNIILVPLMLLIQRFTGSGETGGVAGGMSTIQIFVFVFIYASICEEFLYRGFLQNFLAPLSHKHLRIFGVTLTVPVLTGAVMFGLGHFVVLSTGAGIASVLHIVFLTFSIGLVAGYYMERTGSLITAVIIHMLANLPALIASVFSPATGLP